MPKLFSLIKDCLFPVYCLECKKEGEWVCGDCYKKIKINGPAVDLVVAITKYKEKKLIGRIIKTLKYDCAEGVMVVIERMIDDFLQKNIDLFQDVNYIVPVPLHKKRYVERGFNQAELIANLLARKINKPIKNVLLRDRYTKQQAKLTREERIINVKDAFSIKGKINGTVLLVDDVYTTGSTMQECSRVLKNAGAEKVVRLVVARG